jgi:hypothetical protein
MTYFDYLFYCLGFTESETALQGDTQALQRQSVSEDLLNAAFFDTQSKTWSRH